MPNTANSAGCKRVTVILQTKVGDVLHTSCKGTHEHARNVCCLLTRIESRWPKSLSPSIAKTEQLNMMVLGTAPTENNVRWLCDQHRVIFAIILHSSNNLWAREDTADQSIRHLKCHHIISYFTKNGKVQSCICLSCHSKSRKSFKCHHSHLIEKGE